MIVVDASLVLELVLVTLSSTTIRERLRTDGRPLAAPQVLDLEILQALRRQVRLKQLEVARADAVLEIFASLPIVRYPHEILWRRIWSLRENATAYDAAYVALAEFLDAPLWTCDRKFLGIPGQSAAIEIL